MLSGLAFIQKQSNKLHFEGIKGKRGHQFGGNAQNCWKKNWGWTGCPIISTIWVTLLAVVQKKGGLGFEHLDEEHLPKELQGVEEKWQNVGNSPYLLYRLFFFINLFTYV